MPLIVLVFKIAGLYDRDQLRIVHSTLDEAPTLLQLTGLYVLSVTILQSVMVDGTLGGDQIARAVGDELRRGRRAAASSPAGRARARCPPSAAS